MQETIERLGSVQAVSGKKILIRVEEVSPCSGCNGRCGMVLWSRFFPSRKPIWITSDQIFLKGERVKVIVLAKRFLYACLGVYLLPLLSMIVSMTLSSVWFKHELVMLSMGMIGLFAGMLISRRLKARIINVISLT